MNLNLQKVEEMKDREEQDKLDAELDELFGTADKQEESTTAKKKRKRNRKKKKKNGEGDELDS